MSYLLLQVVRLPDHVPSALHERNGDPAIRYPVSQANEAWEPNKYPHEREVIDPLFGGWRPGQDFPVDKIYFPLIKSSCLRVLRISRQRLFWHIAHILPQDTLW